MTLDSPDQFVLAQLRGASYFTVARNVRPADAVDGYTGPLWDLVRVDEPQQAEGLRPQSTWRIYYLNVQTGLPERVEYQLNGEEIRVEFLEWTEQQGEMTPVYVRWTSNGQPMMEYRAATVINNKAFTVNTANNRLGVPVGQSGVMTYDTVGNLTNDTYTGMGGRTYDAENKMTQAADNTGQVSRYTYDSEGKRVKRQVASSQEDWQIYGFAGELLAEYRASSPASSPQKEYGYRNGQLLVTATGRYNVALAANGAVATASSTATGSGFSTTGAINGNYRGPWGNSVEGWNDNTPNSVPDWIQVDFADSKTIDEISVFSLHDNYTQENTPTETQTFTLYGLLNFNVEYWNGSSWVTVPGGSVTGNNKVWRKFTFSPITTSKIRVYITAVPDAWSRVVEIQAFGTSAGDQKVQWLISDHLGTPRMVFDQTGSLANMKRHDYLPFGEELVAPTSGRSAAQGYSGGDGVRQQLTSYEHDSETSLDYAQNRYYSTTMGRFTTVDPANTGAISSLPQSWNGYSYTHNRPTFYVDPDGLKIRICDNNNQCTEISDEVAKDYLFNKDYASKNGFTTDGYGRIWNHNAQIIGTYTRISFDDLSDQANEFLFQVMKRTAPIPRATWEFAKISVKLGTRLGVGWASAGTDILSILQEPTSPDLSIGTMLTNSGELYLSQGDENYLGFVLNSDKGEILIFAKSVTQQGDTLIIDDLSIQGAGANTVGLSSTRQYARDIGKAFGAKEVIIQGGQRTSGANPGRTPVPIRVRVK